MSFATTDYERQDRIFPRAAGTTRAPCAARLPALAAVETRNVAQTKLIVKLEFRYDGAPGEQLLEVALREADEADEEFPVYLNCLDACDTRRRP